MLGLYAVLVVLIAIVVVLLLFASALGRRVKQIDRRMASIANFERRVMDQDIGE